jgi:CubicO group peptidase (beta-lactamase class C family)
MKSLVKHIIFSAAGISFFATTVLAQVPDRERVIAGAERAFQKAAGSSSGTSPGCAVGVALDGRPVFEKAFGLAELEHRIPNTPETIFESGSVAKQFTAAAVVLLSLEGKLSLDDPVRKYIPELPDYGSPLTIRHMLNHTAGLRDWGAVMALTGAGRGNRVISQDLAVDVIVHQRALDFTPGAEYSYSNSGYNLIPVIVERVSKQKLPAFIEERFFKPLGMTSSSWRDDYRRLVPRRAQAYSRDANGPWRLDMPIMNVYGNGGMLTTVGDWLKWNAMLDSRSMGAPLVDALETTGVLNDGRKITYALGLTVVKYRGLREISHGGATAGYQTFLARYPDQKLSVAVLCNGTSPSAESLVRSIVDEVAGPFPAPQLPESVEVSAEELKRLAGLWRNERTHHPVTTTFQNGVLRLNTNNLRPIRGGSFLLGSTRITFKSGPDGKPVSYESDNDGQITRFVAEPQWTPTAAELESLAGEWYCYEAQASFTIAVDGDRAFIVQRPSMRRALRALYKDHFSVADGQVIWFTRDASGKVARLHVGASRMRDMPFERQKTPAANQQQ